MCDMQWNWTARTVTSSTPSGNVCLLYPPDLLKQVILVSIKTFDVEGMTMVGDIESDPVKITIDQRFKNTIFGGQAAWTEVPSLIFRECVTLRVI